VIVGGIIPDQDVAPLEQAGVAAVYTPKDFDITKIMRDIVALLGADADESAKNGASSHHGHSNGASGSANSTAIATGKDSGIADSGVADSDGAFASSGGPAGDAGAPSSGSPSPA
jgi:hypothetical protein